MDRSSHITNARTVILDHFKVPNLYARYKNYNLEFYSPVYPRISFKDFKSGPLGLALTSKFLSFGEHSATDTEDKKYKLFLLCFISVRFPEKLRCSHADLFLTRNWITTRADGTVMLCANVLNFFTKHVELNSPTQLQVHCLVEQIRNLWHPQLIFFMNSVRLIQRMLWHLK